ncbi:uridine kinase [Deinococcus metalli]|uniref:Uridine kinase n=1 Tax=Deinococcus metalli TaxID=1141878 RepID=A0A7W8KLJ1_9DEIO|nr:hypothetical protein [Deinococcus metalli]MBB5378809.1 uridine kinase [Deinococcus metalli]GHF60607.1 uridine kinase [Deinococcus metalli]
MPRRRGASTAPRVLGLGGGAGSGKTTLAEGLVEALSAQVLHLDDFNFQDGARGVFVTNAESGTRHLDLNHPASIDVGRLLAELDRLGQDGGVRTVIVEGHLALALPGLRARLDSSLFVDLPIDLCIVRKLVRKVGQGADAAVVARNYRQSGRPGHLLFVAPSRRHADIVLDGLLEPQELVQAALQQLAALGLISVTPPPG